MFTIDYKGKTVLITGMSSSIDLNWLAGVSSWAEGQVVVEESDSQSPRRLQRVSHFSEDPKVNGPAGATLIITYTSKDPSSVAEEVSKQYGVPVHVYRCPGEDSKAVDEFVEKASKEVGEIDVVIANAGEWVMDGGV